MGPNSEKHILEGQKEKKFAYDLSPASILLFNFAVFWDSVFQSIS